MKGFQLQAIETPFEKVTAISQFDSIDSNVEYWEWLVEAYKLDVEKRGQGKIKKKFPSSSPSPHYSLLVYSITCTPNTLPIQKKIIIKIICMFI